VFADNFVNWLEMGRTCLFGANAFGVWLMVLIRLIWIRGMIVMVVARGRGIVTGFCV